MKLLATDYDGTLNYGGRVMEEDVEAIRQWRKQGNLFVIATGRSKESIDVELKKNNIEVDFLVTNNGGMVFDHDGTEYESNYLDTITALDIIYVAKSTEGVGGYVVNDGYKRHRIIIREDILDGRHDNLAPDLREEEVMDLGRFSQIVITCNDINVSLAICEEMNRYLSHKIVAYANDHFVNVVPAGVSKATGLEFVHEFAGVDEQDVYVVTDGYNDIPLLEEFDNNYAMEMAPAEVAMHAKQLCKSLHEAIKEIEAL